MDRDYGLSPEQREIVGAVREFVRDRVRPEIAGFEARKEFPRDQFRTLGEMGLAGIPYSEKYGGGEQPFLTYLAVLEEIAMGGAALAAGLSVHHLSAYGIHEFGSDELKEKYLPKLFSGEWLGAYALSEASSGSDAASLQTQAKQDDGHYVLNGSKRFISQAGEADFYLVMARTGADSPKGISAFAVEKGWEGFDFGKLEDKMGWHASPMRELLFDGCRVPPENLVGEEGQGFTVALSALDGGRLGIAACAVGHAQAALDLALSYAKERKQFGQPIADFQNTQFMLADMETELQAARMLLYAAAVKVTENAPDKTKFAAMAKRLATDTGSSVVDRALQLHGGYGYLMDYPIERFWRDLRVHSILEGTNQVMRMIVGRELTRQ